MKNYRLLLYLYSCPFFCTGTASKVCILFHRRWNGVNQVLGTEMYRGELEGKIGVTPLLFTQFPYATIATTFSATNGVTDSAAAGTALTRETKQKWRIRCEKD